MIAKPPLIAKPGWFSDESKRKTTPAASASVASRNFLDDAATPPCGGALLCPTSFAGHGGIEDNWRESRSPLLAQGGVAAPIKKMSRSLLSGRRWGGWFKPPIIGSGTNHPGRASKGTGPFT